MMKKPRQVEKKIRVLHILDKCAIRGSPIHGVTRLLLGWMPEFKKTDIVLSVCVLRTEEGCNGFSQLGTSLDVLNRGKLDPRTILDLVNIIKRDKIQILHCHGYGAATFGRVASFITRKPVIIHEHMIDAGIPLHQKIADKILSPLTSKGVAISKAVKTFMVEARSIPERSMQVIYNSIPADYCNRYTDEQKIDNARKYNIPQNKALVGIVGRLDPLKDHATFLLAARKILKAVPETCFIVVGSGELKLELEEYALQLGIQNDVLFLGHCENVMEIISLFDVHTSSSLSEGLGLTIQEAMAQGKPVVATSVGGIPEIISDGENGFLVPAKSADKLADKIIKLLYDDQLRHELGENALKHCQKFFLAPASVDKLIKLYNELL